MIDLPRPALLENYIQEGLQILRAEENDSYTGTTYPIFFPSVQPPTILPGRVNRVLIFDGCFNPPHNGHLQSLKHSFKNIGSDLNVVAAFIKFACDSNCAMKDHSSPQDSFILTRQQRISIWRDNPGTRECLPWAWFCPLGFSKFCRLLRLICEAAGVDGFDLRWIWLVGGDYVSRSGMLPDIAQELVVTNLGRPVDFYGVGLSTQVVDSIPGFLPWRKLLVPASGTQPGQRHHRQDYGHLEAQSVTVFHCQRDPSREEYPEFIRFVPDGIGNTLVPGQGLSSTKIRHAIATVPIDELAQILESQAQDVPQPLRYVRDYRQAKGIDIYKGIHVYKATRLRQAMKHLLTRISSFGRL